ncbi:hypothetical protein WJX72_005944 [[Myrmecia] bisecta]|uniref:ARID domain-containing protein n=1 Tax=[Myrmecia] bisecta TaxID=41462 RepID=A0AAW1Q7V9_9CHLO
MQALLGLHEAQGTQFAHPKMYGRSDIAAHRIWQEVMSYGGYEGVLTYTLWRYRWEPASCHCDLPPARQCEDVTTYTLWATIANCLGAPPTATDKSYVCKKYYTENLLAFEQASRRGETGIAIPPVTRDPAEYGRARGGGAKRAATTQTIKPVPKKRKGSQMQATPAAPSAPPTRKVVGLVRLSPAGHLKPGDEVEHRSPLVCYCGGWFRAKVIKVVPGSKQEGYWRHYVECHEFTEEHDASLRRREWVPLLQPEANSGVPAVMIRRAVLPAEPPAPLRTWHVGDRVESFWEDGWWMATVTRIMPDGNVQIRSDPSPRPSSPEVFVRAPDRLRPAHPEEKTGFGMLEPPRDDDMVPYQQWRRQLQWQRHSVDGFTFEAFACAALLPPPSTAPTPASQLEAQAAPAESAPAAADANNGAAMASRTVSTGDMAPAAATETGGISTGEAQASVVVNGDHQLTPNEEVSGDRGADSDLEIDLDNEEFGQSEADMEPCSATPGTSEGPSSSERAASQGDAQYRTTTDGRVMRIRSNGSLQHMSAELVGGLLAKARASGNAVYVQNLERLLDWVRSVAQKHAAKGH